METEKLYKTMHGIFQPTEQPHFIDVSKLLTPFTNIGGIERQPLIYDGIEKIPFNERHPTYQEIFVDEFLTYSNIPLGNHLKELVVQ
ncbi:MAG: hypothetical protein ACFFCV_03045 [Promethearchaeota archaeon]